jgi:hypothetical protein
VVAAALHFRAASARRARAASRSARELPLGARVSASSAGAPRLRLRLPIRDQMIDSGSARP